MMRFNSTTIICVHKSNMSDHHGYNITGNATSTDSLMIPLRGGSKPYLWIPYLLIGIACMVFFVIHFWCYHKRNRKRYLRKREEKRVKCGLHERRRITTLMARYQTQMSVASGPKVDEENALLDVPFYGHDNVYLNRQLDENSYEKNGDDYDKNGIHGGCLPLSISMPEGLKMRSDEDKIKHFFNQLSITESDRVVNDGTGGSLFTKRQLHSPNTDMRNCTHQQTEDDGNDVYHYDDSDICDDATASVLQLLTPTTANRIPRSRACSVPNMSNVSSPFTKAYHTKYHTPRFCRGVYNNIPTIDSSKTPFGQRNVNDWNNSNKMCPFADNSTTGPSLLHLRGQNNHQVVSPFNSTNYVNPHTLDSNISNGLPSHSRDISFPSNHNTTRTQFDSSPASSVNENIQFPNSNTAMSVEIPKTTVKPSVVTIDIDKPKTSILKTPALRALDSSLVFKH